MTLSSDAIDQRVLLQFRVVFGSVRTHFQHIEQAVGLSGVQAWALAVIGEQPGIDIHRLAQAMNISNAYASSLLRTLQKRGLVQVDKDAEGQQTAMLSLSSIGRNVLSKVPAPPSGILPLALKKLSPEVLARLEQDLDILIQSLDADPQASQIPLANL